MRIDNECIRDILFAIEKESTTSSPCYISSKNNIERLKKYDEEKLSYHLRYLRMKQMIYNPDQMAPYGYDLMPSGHEFLSNIRDDSNWNKIKSVSSNIGFASLKIVSAIAEGVATAAINQQLGISK